MLNSIGFQVFIMILILSVCVYLYFMPFAIAYARELRSTKTIFFMNLLLGWTGIGWIGLLAWAFKGKKRTDGEQVDNEVNVRARLREIVYD